MLGASQLCMVTPCQWRCYASSELAPYSGVEWQSAGRAYNFVDLMLHICLQADSIRQMPGRLLVEPL